MTGAVLADTGPLYALADPSDQFHDRAHLELDIIVSRNNTILVIFPVLCEGHTLVLRRLGGKYASGWLSEMLSGSLPLNPEVNDYLEAAGRLRKYSDQPIILGDALQRTGAAAAVLTCPVNLAAVTTINTKASFNTAAKVQGLPLPAAPLTPHVNLVR